MSTNAELPTEPWTPEPEDTSFHHYDDDGVARGRYTSRWQKHGHDRIYMAGDQDGYIDLNEGEIVDLEPVPGTGVEEYKFEYCADDDCLYLWAVAEEGVPQNSLSKKTRSAVARIPRSVMGAN